MKTAPRANARPQSFKGHSQLMHMRIRYHFLADLHVTRLAWNRKWEAYPEYSKLTNLELVKNRIVIIDPKPYQNTHLFYIPLRIDRWIFPGKAKHRRILLNSDISRGEKLHEVWTIVEGSRSRKLDFPNKCSLLHRISKYITIICLSMLADSFLKLFW